MEGEKVNEIFFASFGKDEGDDDDIKDGKGEEDDEVKDEDVNKGGGKAGVFFSLAERKEGYADE